MIGNATYLMLEFRVDYFIFRYTFRKAVKYSKPYVWLGRLG